MGVDFQGFVVALAQLTDSELNALMDATKNVPQIAPGFRAWLAAVLDWELSHRRGQAHALQPPAFSLAPEEAAANISSVRMVRALFGQGAPGAHMVFDALGALLSGGGERKQ
jgi:hypothetical protein